MSPSEYAYNSVRVLKQRFNLGFNTISNEASFTTIESAQTLFIVHWFWCSLVFVYWQRSSMEAGLFMIWKEEEFNEIIIFNWTFYKFNYLSHWVLHIEQFSLSLDLLFDQCLDIRNIIWARLWELKLIDVKILDSWIVIDSFSIFLRMIHECILNFHQKMSMIHYGRQLIITWYVLMVASSYRNINTFRNFYFLIIFRDVHQKISLIVSLGSLVLG